MVPSSRILTRVSRDGRRSSGQAQGDLVEDDELGVGHQRAADGQLLLLAAGELLARLVAPFGQHLEQVVHPVETLLQAVLRRPMPASTRFSCTVRSAKMCRPSMQCARPSRATSCAASDVMSGPRNVMRPAVAGIMPLGDARGRRLAGAVGAEQGHDLAVVHVEADVGERLEAAVARGHVVEREDRAGVLLDLVRRDARHDLLAAGAQVAGDDLGLGQDLLHGAVGDEAAEVEHRDPVAALGDDVHDVLDDDDGLDAVTQGLDDLDELEDLGLHETGADLVHEQDARLERQRARQLEPLELQQREVGGFGVRTPQAEVVQDGLAVGVDAEVALGPAAVVGARPGGSRTPSSGGTGAGSGACGRCPYAPACRRACA